MSVRVGLIGCGEWGRNHARVLSRFGVLKAVADTLPDRARAFAARCGCRASTPDELIADPRIDAVVISVLPSAHADLARRVLLAGKHVLVEKPMALDSAAAQRICDAARLTGRVAMTGHILRFHPAFDAILKMIDGGVLGAPYSITARRKSYGKFFPNVSAVRDLAPHDLALLLAISRRAPVASSGRYTSVMTDLPDVADFDLDFGDGLTANLQLSRVYEGKERKFTVHGSKATAIFDDLSPWPEKLMLAYGDGAPEPVKISETAPLDAQMRHFLDCILDPRTEPLSSAEHGLAVIRTIDGIDLRHVAQDEMPGDLFTQQVVAPAQLQARR